MHGRDSHGAISSLGPPWRKLPFKDAQDGISNTFSIIPGALGKDDLIISGDLSIDLESGCDCGPDMSCGIPNLMEGIDDNEAL